MLGLFRFLFKAFMAISIAITSFMNSAVIVSNSENLDFNVLEYPAEAVKTLEEWGLTEETLKSRADSEPETYISNQGYDDINGVIVSPYYTAKIAEKDIPVYVATVFLGETQYGELHSFSEVYLDEGEEFSLNIELYSKDFRIRNAICNSKNGTIDRCFARSGDDLFDVKTLGGPADASAENITFQNCVDWGGKARCYGIHGEVNSPIKNITFRDSAVICRDATWNNNRVASFSVIIELAEGSIDGVLFDNIEIFRDDGRAMACVVFTEEIGDMDTVPIYNFTANNVVFRNITYTAAMKSKFSAENDTNTINVTVENANFKKFNSATDNWLIFESDKFANVTYK